jgi:CO/xanthine dehydrogenase Mo-binding subunit
MTKSIIDGLDLAGNGKNKARTLGIEEEDPESVSYRVAKTCINKLLACDREVLVPTRVASYTVDELAKELGIKPDEVRRLRTMTMAYWGKVRGKLNLRLASLYLNTKFYEK